MNENYTISVVIPTFNNFDELKKTLQSTIESFPKSEILIIDSSENKKIIPDYLENLAEFNIKYQWLFPHGVYAAQNLGIENAFGRWIIIMNSGDNFLNNAGENLIHAIKTHPQIDIHVFSQISGVTESNDGVCFVPSVNSFWPHQSTVVKRSIYEIEGTYDCDFKYMSEQKYFAEVRSKYNFMIHKIPLTYYDLGGISSKYAYKNCIENYKVRQLLGESRFKSIIRGFVTPLIRSLLHIFIDIDKVAVLKATLFSRNYFKNK